MEIQRLELEKAKIAYDQNIKAVKTGEKALDLPFSVPRTYEVTPDDNVNLSMLKNGASRRAVELAYQASQWNFELKENKIKYDVQKAYFDLLQMEKELKISEENLTLSNKQYEHGKLKYDLGNISQQQLLGLEMGVHQAQSIYDTTKMYYEMQLMSFKNTLGLPLEKEVALTDKIEIKEYETIDLNKSIELALENNVYLKQAEENHEISKLILQATSGRFPEITFRYKEKEVEVHQAAKLLENTKTSVELGVRSAYLNLITAQKQIKTYEMAIKQAEQLVKIAQTSFDLGQSTATDLYQANINLMNAKKNLSQQIHAYNLALLDYEYSIGIGKGM